MQVAIIGAGPLGRWLAFAAARAGYTVLLEDVMPSNLHHAQEYLRQQLGPSALPMVEFASTIEAAVREADLAIDCVPDELESKLEIFCLLDRMAPPRTVFVSPMTRLSIADLASCTYRAGKCVALVANVQELTEASIGESKPGEQGREILLRTPPQITPETIATVREFWERIGFVPRFEADHSQC
jgi:3-hydroxybutyryl-CoA dehydrogenase